MIFENENIPQSIGVYAITNTLLNKKYFGYSKNLKTRASQWKSAFNYWNSFSNKENTLSKYDKKYYHINEEMKKDFIIYDSEIWKFEVIEFCISKNEAEILEYKLIKENKDEIYNIVSNPLYQQFTKNLIKH